jgi:hypothetical protein
MLGISERALQAELAQYIANGVGSDGEVEPAIEGKSKKNGKKSK